MWRSTKDSRSVAGGEVSTENASGADRPCSGSPVFDMIDVIVTSPFVRCVETVEPLAKKKHLKVERNDALAEGARLPQALRLFEKLQDREAVLCTHGDVLEDLLDHFGRHGVKLRDHRMEKGSVWVFDVEHGVVRRARYVRPGT